MSASDDDANANLRRAKRTGRRVTSLVFFVLAAGFVVMTTGEFTVQAFDAGITPASPACTAALRALEAAVDRAAAVPTTTATVDEARATFETAIGPADGAALAACASSADEEAYAAARRFAMAARQRSILRTGADVAAARQSLESRLGP